MVELEPASMAFRRDWWERDSATSVNVHLLGRTPSLKKLVRFEKLDLLVEASSIHRHQGIMAFVRRAAQRVLDNHHPKSEIDGAEHAGEHADVGFGAGHDDRVELSCHQHLVQA